MENLKQDFRCGMVSIVGRPNVGKSTLLNALVDEKIAIVSPIPQTTRNQVRGVYTDERCQIIFIDTPGFHQKRDHLDAYMNQSAFGTTHDADCIIHLVDIQHPPGAEEEEIIRKLCSLNVPIVLGISKMDLKGQCLSQYVQLWETVSGKCVQDMSSFTMIPLSGQKGKNIDQLIDILYDYLPQGPALYPMDAVTDVPQRMVLADIIREKLLNSLREEIPHSLAVIIEDMQKKRRQTYHIQALVLVETPSQKGIVIGKDGHVLKNIGILARKEIEELLESKVFLDLYVKVRPKWRDNKTLLQEMGYDFL